MDLEPPTSHRSVQALEQIAFVLRAAAIVTLVAAIVWLLGDVLLLTFCSALLALGLRGGAIKLSRLFGCSIGIALAVELLALLVLFGVAAWWTGPQLATQAVQLKDQIVQQWGSLREWLHTRPWGDTLLSQLPAGLGGGGQGAGGQAGSGEGGGGFPTHLAGTIVGAVSSAIGLLGTAILILAATIYFAAAPEPYVAGPLKLLPRQYRDPTRAVLDKVGHTLQHWLAGQLLDMVAVGIVTGVGLALLGMPLALVLGVLAGLLNFVPYIGAIAGAVPAILIALAQGPHQALFVAALYAVVQGLEGNVLSPLIQRRAVDLPPAATILAQTAFGALLGLPGIILATPVAAAILTALREVTADDEEKGGPAKHAPGDHAQGSHSHG